MQVLSSGKQLEMGESFRTYIETQTIAAVDKHFQNAIRSNVVVSREANLFCVDISVDVGHDLGFRAQGSASAPYVAFDLALKHMTKQLRRHKRKLKSHHRSDSPKNARRRTIAFGLRPMMQSSPDDRSSAKER